MKYIRIGAELTPVPASQCTLLQVLSKVASSEILSSDFLSLDAMMNNPNFKMCAYRVVTAYVVPSRWGRQ